MSVGVAGRRVTRIAKIVVDVTWWLGIAVVLAGAALILFWPLASSQGLDPSSHVQVSIADQRAGDLLPESIERSGTVEVMGLGDLEGSLELRLLKWWVVVLGGLAALPAIAAGLFGLHLLRSFLRDVQAARVFTARNARRLSWIGWLLVLGGVVFPLIHFVYSVFLVRQAGVLGNPVGVGIDGFTTVVPGLLVLVVAAAWRHGVELQQDHDLTV